MTITVLICDDEAPARYAMKKALARTGCTLLEASDGQAALTMIRDHAPELVFLDLNMPSLDGLQVLQALHQDAALARHCDVIVVTANDALDTAIECMRLGAVDYLTKPYEIERLRAQVTRTAKRVTVEQQLGQLRQQLDRETACGALIGVSRAMRELFNKLRRAAATPLDILICGETGTGKELIAHELHRLSPRHEGPFIAVNTAAIYASLAESELFGHVKGAFTGADKNRTGVFEQAHRGTLFMDEIGDMPIDLQAKILRVLQEREVQAVGSTRRIPIDIRIVSATHQDLTQAVSDGQFREDLYYRLKGIELFAPPLRQRQEDITLLSDYFLEQLAQQTQTAAKHLSEAAVRCLLAHHWPGNVRELQQTINAAGAMALEDKIDADDLALNSSQQAAQTDDGLPALAGLPLSEGKALLLEWYERNTIAAALRQTQGNVSAAARQLGIHRQNLQQKMHQLGIQRDALI